LHPAAAVSALDLLRWPGIVKEKPTDVRVVAVQAMDLLEQALAALNDMRAREGQRIVELLQERAHRIQTTVTEIRGHTAGVQEQLRTKLRMRLGELQISVDQNRLEQELVLLLQRLDVSEELDRLDGHVRELESALKGKEAVGRRLDFLMQEFNREANTLGSKCQDTAVTKLVVNLKVLIEQMREQVQNVE